jgi:hypothetical protein
MGVEWGAFGILIEAKHRSEIKLIDERADKSDGMVRRNLLIDFFSTRRFGNQASEKRENFGRGSCGSAGLGVTWELVLRGWLRKKRKKRTLLKPPKQRKTIFVPSLDDQPR